jgi:hypothetical protein
MRRVFVVAILHTLSCAVHARSVFAILIGVVVIILRHRFAIATFLAFLCCVYFVHNLYVISVKSVILITVKRSLRPLRV